MLFSEERAKFHLNAYREVRTLWFENLINMKNKDTALLILEYSMRLSHGMDEPVFISHFQDFEDILSNGRDDPEFRFVMQVMSAPELISLLDELIPGYLIFMIAKKLDRLVEIFVYIHQLNVNEPAPFWDILPIQAAIINQNRSAFLLFLTHEGFKISDHQNSSENVSVLETAMASEDPFYVKHLVCHPSTSPEQIINQVEFVKFIESGDSEKKENGEGRPNIFDSPSFIYLDTVFREDPQTQLKKVLPLENALLKRFLPIEQENEK